MLDNDLLNKIHMFNVATDSFENFDISSVWLIGLYKGNPTHVGQYRVGQFDSINIESNGPLRWTAQLEIFMPWHFVGVGEDDTTIFYADDEDSAIRFAELLNTIPDRDYRRIIPAVMELNNQIAKLKKSVNDLNVLNTVMTKLFTNPR